MKQLKIFLEAARKLLREFLGLIFALVFFLVSPYFLRLFDPTAGTYDAGVIQVILFAIVGQLTFSFLSWIGVRINFHPVFDYMQIDFINDFKNLQPWQKVKAFLFIYFGYLALFVLLARIL